jgi:hypothetical protein
LALTSRGSNRGSSFFDAIELVVSNYTLCGIFWLTNCVRFGFSFSQIWR